MTHTIRARGLPLVSRTRSVRRASGSVHTALSESTLGSGRMTRYSELRDRSAIPRAAITLYRFNSFCNSASSCSASIGRNSSTFSDRIRSAIPYPTGSNIWICTGPRSSACASSSADDVLRSLVQLQHFARALDHGQRQPGQPRDLDAVAAVRLARLHLAQEDDVVARFLHATPSGCARRRAARPVPSARDSASRTASSRACAAWTCSTTAHASASPS